MFLPEALESPSLPVPAPGAAPIPGLMVITPNSASVVTALSALTLLPLSQRMLGPAWVTQDSLSISSSLRNRICRGPLPCKGACSQVPGARMGTSWGAVIQPTTVGFPLFSESPLPRQSTPSPIGCYSKAFFTPLSSQHPPIRSLSPDSLKSRLKWKILTLYSYRTEFNK